jgi:hypothetical protein
MDLTPSFFPVKIASEFTGIIGHHLDSGWQQVARVARKAGQVQD